MNKRSDYTARLLQQLHRQIHQLYSTVNLIQNDDTRGQAQRFDRQLFTPVVKHPKEYLLEIEKNFVALEQQVSHRNFEQTLFLSEKLHAQISALQRELATQSLRQSESAQNAELTERDLYQKLAQHQDYQRRLQNMIREKETLLALQNAFSSRQSIQKEIVVLEGRYSRCSSAIRKLEQQIERSETLYR